MEYFGVIAFQMFLQLFFKRFVNVTTSKTGTRMSFLRHKIGMNVLLSNGLVRCSHLPTWWVFWATSLLICCYLRNGHVLILAPSLCTDNDTCYSLNVM